MSPAQRRPTTSPRSYPPRVSHWTSKASWTTRPSTGWPTSARPSPTGSRSRTPATSTSATSPSPTRGSPAPSACPSDTLARGTSEVCTATYTVTQADIDAGVISNTATATGTPPPGDGPPVTSAPASSSVNTAARTPGISLTKTGLLVDGNGNRTADVGETVNYTFTVTNSGNVTLTGVAVDDPKVGPVTCPATPVAPRDTRELHRDLHRRPGRRRRRAGVQHGHRQRHSATGRPDTGDQPTRHRYRPRHPEPRRSAWRKRAPSSAASPVKWSAAPSTTRSPSRTPAIRR